MYTALRYKNDMGVFEHHTDGMLLSHKKKKKEKSPEDEDSMLTKKQEEEFDLAAVSLHLNLFEKHL